MRSGMLAACPYPSWQGTQVFVRHLATALQAAGHQLDLVCFGTAAYVALSPFPVHRGWASPVGLRSGPQLLRPLADLGLLAGPARPWA